MVIQSILPNLLNVAQIIILFSNNTSEIQKPLKNINNSFSLLTPHVHWSKELISSNKNENIEQILKKNDEKLFLPYNIQQNDECNLEVISIHSQKIVNLIFNDNYDKTLLPDPNGVTVSIELALQTFYDISENSASFTADVLMR